MSPPSVRRSHLAPIRRDQARRYTPGRAQITLVDGCVLDIDSMHAGPEAIADEVATAQRRVVSYAQLLAAGMTRSAVGHRVATGRLHRVHRGVYIVGHPDPLPLARETAALLACGPYAALSHHTGGHLWKMRTTEPVTVHVLVAGFSPRPGPTVAVHLTGAWDRVDVRYVHGLPVTSPTRTILDLASVVSERDLHWAVEEACVLRIATRAEIADQLLRTPRRRGAAALQRVLAAGQEPALTRSEAERRLQDLVRAARLPAPATNVRVEGFELDACWSEERLVVEVDGFAFHGSRSAFERDRRRDAALQVAGFRVMRVTWRQLVDEPEAVVATVARLLEQGASSPRNGGG